MRSYAETRDTDDLNRALKTLDISDASATTEIGIEEASQLSAVFARMGDMVAAAENVPDSLPSDQKIYALFPSSSPVYRINLPGYLRVKENAGDHRIELSKNKLGEWRFSSATLDDIGQFLTAIEAVAESDKGEVFLTNAQWIRRHIVPPSLKQGRLLRIEYWQWIGIFLLLLVGFTLDRIIRWTLQGIWSLIVRRQGTTPDPTLVRKAVRPFGMFASAMVFYFGVELIGLPAAFVFTARLAVRVFLVLTAVQALFRLTDLVADLLERKALETDTKLDDLLVPLFRKVVKVFLLVLATAWIADYFNLPILPLLSGLGIGGLAFAFAAKDTIENFFGSIAVIADRPFEVGDWVVIGDAEGTVEGLGLRSTRIRTFYNSVITVPNADLVRATVDNYGRRNIRRYKTMLNLAYNTPPERIEAFCEGVRELIRQHPSTFKDSYHVWLNSFGAHSLDVLVYMFFQTPDWATELRERHRFMLDVLRLGAAMGVEFAYPTQTLHLLKPGEGMPMASPIEAGKLEGESRAAGRTLAARLVEDMPWKTHPPGQVRFDIPAYSPPPPPPPAPPPTS